MLTGTSTHIKLPKNILFAGIVGNGLEWYDFLLYAYFTPIIAPLFFPAKNEFISLIAALGVFALGFLFRPLGAFVIGRWGDLYGRRKTLIYSISLMTIPTVALGLLPSYAAWGIAAPIILTLIRCVQGFAVSGEISTAASFLIEHSHESRRGYTGSLVMSSAFMGILVGAIVVTIFSELIPAPALQAWGWRLPFLLAGVFGIFGLIIRLRAIESPQFTSNTAAEHAPIKLLFRDHWREVLCGVGLTIVVAIGNYFIVAYFTTYLVEFAGLAHKDAMLVNVISMFILILVLLFFGFLADKWGRKPVFIIGILSIIIFILPVLWLLAQKTFLTALGAEVLFVLILAPNSALILTLLTELFPVAVRNSGVALSYNIALTLFGGTTPLIALSLIKVFSNDLAPAIYIIVGAIFSCCSLLFIRKSVHIAS